jgi:hypothetical protein
LSGHNAVKIATASHPAAAAPPPIQVRPPAFSRDPKTAIFPFAASPTLELLTTLEDSFGKPDVNAENEREIDSRNRQTLIET